MATSTVPMPSARRSRWPGVLATSILRGPAAVPHLTGQARPVDVGVDAVEEAVHGRVGRGDAGRQVSPEAGAVTRDPLEPADEPHATVAQHAEVEVRCGTAGVVSADELQRRLPPGRLGVGHVVDGPGEPTGRLEPPEDVQAPVATGHPRVPADGEGHVAPGPAELVRDLQPGRRRAHDEHATGGELGRIAVVDRGDRLDALETGRHVRRPVRAGGDHDVAGVPRALGRDHPVAAAGLVAGLDGQDGRALDDGSAERVGVLLEEGDELSDAQEPVGVGPGVAPARQAGHPARRQQVQ